MSDLDDAKELIARSGTLFHANVLRLLIREGWSVVVSPYYTDTATSRSREIDLIAEKPFHVVGREGQGNGSVNVRLFIECKYISRPTIAWTYSQDLASTKRLLAQRFKLSPIRRLIDEHHYVCSTEGRVAKIFESTGNKDTEQEPMFKAINQVLHSLITLRDATHSIVPNADRRDVEHTVNYPVIACKSFEKVFQVELERAGDPEPVKRRLVAEVNYGYAHPMTGKHVAEFFLIDVVSFDLLSKLLNIVGEDAARVGLELSR